MTRPCDIQATGAIELYFYDELDAAERARLDAHLPVCATCRAALRELEMIRTALATRPDVSAPPAGDWSGFMSRLDARLRPVDRYSDDEVPTHRSTDLPTHRSTDHPTDRSTDPPTHRSTDPPTHRSTDRPIYRTLAMAALLALVTMSVFAVLRWREASAPESRMAEAPATPSVEQPSPRAALAATSHQHLERSKLVLLGLTSKDADVAAAEDWTYERELAENLLADTRLYRMAAEERGMDALASVLKDLELVLLETSFTESDPGALGQIQRLIRKRDLIGKMEVVTSSGI